MLLMTHELLICETMEVSQLVPWGIVYSRVCMLSLSQFECPRSTFKRDLLLMTDGSLSFIVFNLWSSVNPTHMSDLAASCGLILTCVFLSRMITWKAFYRIIFDTRRLLTRWARVEERRRYLMAELAVFGVDWMCGVGIEL